MLSICNLSFLSDKKRTILDSVSLQVSPGEIVGLTGGSGSGKSTIFYSLFQDFFPHRGGQFKGTIEIQGKIQCVIQDPLSGFNPLITMDRLLTEPLRIMGMKQKLALDKIYQLISRVGMENENLNRYPHEFSGGQLQRLLILRAIISNPSYLIMDEPVSGLDPLIRKIVINLILEIHSNYKPGILFISHDLDVVKNICTRVYVLKEGKIVDEGVFPDFPNSSSHSYSRELFISE